MESEQHSLTTATSTLLLEGLKDPGNESIWKEYIGRYRPMLVRYASRVGIDREDAEDVAQQILVAFAEAYRRGKYGREKGRLRTWLFGFARIQVLNWRKRDAKREKRISSSSDETDLFERIASPDELEESWEQEWKDAVLAECLREARRTVEPRTFDAFRLFVCEGWSARRVSEHLAMSENAVFGAKRRVLHRIRDLLPQLEEHW